MKFICGRGNEKSMRTIGEMLNKGIADAVEAAVEAAVKEPKEEWIWVEGYKGTDKDMKCRDFQYEIGGAYHEDDVTLCSSGFHLCLKLEDVFGYYGPGNGNRYFKVKALVRKSDYEKYGKRPTTEFVDGLGHTVVIPLPFSSAIDKLAAKEIIFLEEVDTSVVYENIRTEYEMLKDASDDIIKIAIEKSIDDAVAAYREDILVNDGYSRPFAHLIVKDHEDKFDMAHILAGEKELSMDVRVLCILKG